MPPKIDLRSDTVTQPTSAMRAAMAAAEVGDDVICSDPTVERLQATIAEMLGKPAALFMPSGTMANQVGIRVHCQPGDEFICESECHVYRYEQGAFAQLSGLVPKLIPGRNGLIHPDQLQGCISPDDDHALRTRLITLENTHNRGGGTIQPFPHVKEICAWAKRHGILTHLDGARLFNAAIASGIELKDWAACFDSVSVCFSKGLGAPVGSALVGEPEYIRQARRARKLFGGGMRQAGVLAAAALYALEHHQNDLERDHQHAQYLASIASQCEGLHVDQPPQTNILIIRIAPELATPQEFVAELAEHDVGSFPFGAHQIRLVTHRDVDEESIRQAGKSITMVAESLAAARIS